MHNAPTFPEAFGILLALLFLAIGFATFVQVVTAALVAIWHDARDWWKARQIPKGWQPKKKGWFR